MLHILENDLVKACIDDFGAEIKSVIGKKTNTEYMWQGDKAYWGGTAPILFPICGRLFDGKYTHQGKEYEMKIHGFARHSQFVVLEKSNDLPSAYFVSTIGLSPPFGLSSISSPFSSFKINED